MQLPLAYGAGMHANIFFLFPSSRRTSLIFASCAKSYVNRCLGRFKEALIAGSQYAKEGRLKKLAPFLLILKSRTAEPLLLPTIGGHQTGKPLGGTAFVIDDRAVLDIAK